MANNNKKGNKRNFKENLNDNDNSKNDISQKKNKIKIVNKKQLNDKTILSDTSDDEHTHKNVENNFENMLTSLIKDFDPTKNPWGNDPNKNIWSSEPIIVKAPFDLFFPKGNLQDEKNDQNKPKKTEIDLASMEGNIKKLEDWMSKNVESGKFDLKHADDYTSESLDGASLNNKLEVLNWWLISNKKYAVPLKYTEKSMIEASKLGLINILNWWYDSNLTLKYNENAINNASIKNKINVLDWWFGKIKEKRVEFKYSQSAFDKCKLPEKDMLELLKWWKDKFENHKMIFLYGKEFIDFIVTSNYDEVIKYLLDNKLLTEDDIKKRPPKRLGLNNLFEMFGNPKKEHSSKFDTSTLPKDIQDHIKEKEEELNNNMLINGKAKEYIDNLVKIPFGKYREEKIFKFINELIQKLNTKYKLELKNESDLLEYFKTNQNTDYYKLYQQFCEYRIKYLEYVDKTLDKCVYGHTQTKKQIKCILAQWLSGGIKKGVVIGIQGPPGVGKTTIIKGALALCIVDFIDYNLDEDKPKEDKSKEDKQDKLWIKIVEESCNVKRPFCFISLGGSTNSSTLIGHNITYHGATSGDIVKSLKEAKYMNPILYFDELDKISKTEHGNEISSVLTHITDPAQNEHFTDRYFSEVKIDLSKCIIIFSYNDQTKIDRILYDRIQEIKLQAIPLLEKVEICKNFLIPEILENMGYNKENIVLSNNELENIILGYTYEAGVRKIKEKLNEILRNYHLNRLVSNQSITNEVLTNDYVDNILNDHHKILLKKITPKPAIGCIHGMYATTNGLGDVMLIQVKKMYNKDLLGLHTTGSLEKVITESIQVARTVAWNLLTDDERKTIETSFVNTGLHIHCPDGSTPKDGPSAGTAITTAIYSLLTGKLIKNDVAITGEIDLDGNVTAIGGLDAKLSGAKRAGIKLALVPTENKRDVEILSKKNTTLVDSKFKVKFISHVNEALKIVIKN